MVQRNDRRKPSTCGLCDRQDELLREYVRKKALLFADEPSGVGVLFSDDERRSLSSSISDIHSQLLETGLSKEAIAHRAKELTLELMDF